MKFPSYLLSTMTGLLEDLELMHVQPKTAYIVEPRAQNLNRTFENTSKKRVQLLR